MIEMLAAVVEPLTAGLLVTVLASLIAALFYPLFYRLSPAVGPESRALLIWLYGLLPVLVASLSVLMLLQPALAAAFMPSHCHGANCAAHRPEFGLSSPAGIGLIGLTAVVLAVALALAQRNLLQNHRRLLLLRHLSRRGLGRHWRLVDSERPLAWCAGILRPQVYISRGLLATLNGEQLQAVLLHEQAHLQRRDNLRAALLQWATVFWPPRARRRLWRDLRQATEAACDQVAAAGADRADLVASAIARLSQAEPTGAAAPTARAGRDCDTDALLQRLEKLRSPQQAGAVAVGSWLMISLLAASQVVGLSVAAHTAIEWITL
ncbi:M56 family metallopeptidase [Parahaliea mediterranea]|uniref:M56 family metallopeptidase n=1 Tax=Parahaliea mediterranea TaxID=651086 RepID=A0A939IP28_9GAMM|nr:M56 family metallopeptidase [Parahaliea mediterranea]MBN7798738.1 M56 family metallopeptidase [Parahaliea mediterranea]